MALTKKEIVTKLNEEIGLPQKECSDIFESLLEIMKDELSKGNPVVISGFGKWSVLDKQARMGRNPKTREAIKIDARKVVTFKASHVLRKELS